MEGHDNSFDICIYKNVPLSKISYYVEEDSHSRNKIKVELDLSNYETKSEVKKQVINQILLKKLI